MNKVTVEEVRRRLENGGKNFTIVDSRAPAAWDSSDVKAAGAVRIPPDEAEKHLADLDRDHYVAAYCT